MSAIESYGNIVSHVEYVRLLVKMRGAAHPITRAAAATALSAIRRHRARFGAAID